MVGHGRNPTASTPAQPHGPWRDPTSTIRETAGRPGRGTGSVQRGRSTRSSPIVAARAVPVGASGLEYSMDEHLHYRTVFGGFVGPSGISKGPWNPIKIGHPNTGKWWWARLDADQ